MGIALAEISTYLVCFNLQWDVAVEHAFGKGMGGMCYAPLFLDSKYVVLEMSFQEFSGIFIIKWDGWRINAKGL